MKATTHSNRIIVKRRSETHIISISGVCDAVMCRRLRQVFAGLIDRGECQLVVDLAEVRYITSAALREFWRAQKHIGENGSLTLRSPCQEVHALLDLSGLLRLSRVHLDSDSVQITRQSPHTRALA